MMLFITADFPHLWCKKHHVQTDIRACTRPHTLILQEISPLWWLMLSSQLSVVSFKMFIKLLIYLLTKNNKTKQSNKNNYYYLSCSMFGAAIFHPAIHNLFQSQVCVPSPPLVPRCLFTAAMTDCKLIYYRSQTPSASFKKTPPSVSSSTSEKLTCRNSTQDTH